MAFHFSSYYHAYEQALEDYNDVLTQTGLLDTRIDQMWSEAQQEDWRDAFVYCKAALQRVSYALKLLIGEIDYPANDPPVIDAIYYNRFAIDHIVFPEPEITWKAIAEAWIKDDFEGRMVTIAVIDHMRKLLWDEPFYVVWASKPKT